MFYVSYNQTPAGCCQTVRVTANPVLGQDVSGLYAFSGLGSSSPVTLAGKPVFQLNNQYCLGYARVIELSRGMFSGGWKVDNCTKNFFNEVGLIRQDDETLEGSACPTEVLSGWTYYGSTTGEYSIQVVCDGKLGNS